MANKYRNLQRVFFIVCVLLATSLLRAAPASARKWRVETVDARMLTGRIESIAKGKVVFRTEAGRRELSVGEIVEMSAAKAPADVTVLPGQAVLKTAQGDALAVTEVSYDGRKLSAAGRVVGKIEMPIESARAILLPAIGRTAAELLKGYEKMGLGKPAGDRLIVTRKGSRDLAVDGVLEGIEADKISFRYQEQSRTIDRKSIPMIFLATVTAKADGAIGTLVARDSSRIRFRSIRLAEGRLTLDNPAAGTMSVKLSDAVSILLASAKVVRLSDMKPASVREHGLFDLTFTHRVNKSVGGKALTMAGKKYGSGLGLHSFCELAYDLDGGFSTFVATVGIDDEAKPNGDATVVFEADGKMLGEKLRVTGRDKPKQIRLDVRGAKRLTIRVEFGEDGLGIGDHVDIAGARLIK